MVTVMPDFACTIHMLNDSKLRADIKDLLFDFLPERRRWAIPLFDQDDETDYKLAETKGERVYPINVQFGDFANSASGEAEYGLYYHSTKWLLSQDLNNLSKVVPKTVLDRWAASGRLDIIKERIKFPVNGTTWEQGFAALQNNLGVKRPSEARDNKDGQETVQQLDNDLDDIFTSLDDI
jgi:hypothetical protein